MNPLSKSESAMLVGGTIKSRSGNGISKSFRPVNEEKKTDQKGSKASTLCSQESGRPEADPEKNIYLSHLNEQVQNLVAGYEEILDKIDTMGVEEKIILKSRLVEVTTISQCQEDSVRIKLGVLAEKAWASALDEISQYSYLTDVNLLQLLDFMTLVGDRISPDTREKIYRIFNVAQSSMQKNHLIISSTTAPLYQWISSNAQEPHPTSSQYSESLLLDTCSTFHLKGQPYNYSVGESEHNQYEAQPTLESEDCSENISQGISAMSLGATSKFNDTSAITKMTRLVGLLVDSQRKEYSLYDYITQTTEVCTLVALEVCENSPVEYSILSAQLKKIMTDPDNALFGLEECLRAYIKGYSDHIEYCSYLNDVLEELKVPVQELSYLMKEIHTPHMCRISPKAVIETTIEGQPQLLPKAISTSGPISHPELQEHRKKSESASFVNCSDESPVSTAPKEKRELDFCETAKCKKKIKQLTPFEQIDQCPNIGSIEDLRENLYKVHRYNAAMWQEIELGFQSAYKKLLFRKYQSECFQLCDTAYLNYIKLVNAYLSQNNIELRKIKKDPSTLFAIILQIYGAGTDNISKFQVHLRESYQQLTKDAPDSPVAKKLKKQITNNIRNKHFWRGAFSYTLQLVAYAYQRRVVVIKPSEYDSYFPSMEHYWPAGAGVSRNPNDASPIYVIWNGGHHYDGGKPIEHS